MNTESKLIKSLRVLFGRGTRLPLRTVHHWRGRKFVINKPSRLGGFAGLVPTQAQFERVSAMAGLSPEGALLPIQFYESDFANGLTDAANAHALSQ